MAVALVTVTHAAFVGDDRSFPTGRASDDDSGYGRRWRGNAAACVDAHRGIGWIANAQALRRLDHSPDQPLPNSWKHDET